MAMKNNGSILIFGFGSTGRRYGDILKAKDFEVYVYKHKKDIDTSPFLPVTNLDDLDNYYAAIIASPTATHLQYLEKLVESNVPTFVEKPLADNMGAKTKKVIELARKNNSKIQTGFNLRYLPIVMKISDLLKRAALGKILHADIYVGQYLPAWRPDKDYRKTYSASFDAGGGVALDLIHEIDLAQMWFGKVDLKVIKSAKLSDLEIDTEDFVQFIAESNPYIKVTLDYLNMVKTRRYAIVGSEGAIECDIFNKKFTYKLKDGREEILTEESLFNIKKTYEGELEDFLGKIGSGKEFDLSDRSLGLDSLKLAVEARENVQR